MKRIRERYENTERKRRNKKGQKEIAARDSEKRKGLARGANNSRRWEAAGKRWTEQI